MPRYWASPWGTSERVASLHAALGAGLATGALRPVIGQELPLAEAAKAHRTVIESRAYGKIVLIPQAVLSMGTSRAGCPGLTQESCYDAVIQRYG